MGSPRMALSVAVAGDGPAVVLLHGWGMHAQVWNGLAAALTHRFEVHAADLPGYGNSTLCAPYRLPVVVDAMAREMPRSCHVVGWSLGALVALAWAKRAPRQVARLALVAATPCFAQRHDWLHGVDPGTLAAFTRDLETDYEGAIERFIGLQALGDDDERRLVRALRKMARQRRPSMGALTGGLQILLDTDLRHELAGIAQPTLVVHGDRDRLTPPAAGRYLERTIPGARLELISGTSHVPFLSQPARVAQILSDFLDG